MSGIETCCDSALYLIIHASLIPSSSIASNVCSNSIHSACGPHLSFQCWSSPFCLFAMLVAFYSISSYTFQLPLSSLATCVHSSYDPLHLLEPSMLVTFSLLYWLLSVQSLFHSAWSRLYCKMAPVVAQYWVLQFAELGHDRCSKMVNQLHWSNQG